MVSPEFLKYRTNLPSSSRRPTRDASPVLESIHMTLEISIGAGCFPIPPGRSLVGV